MKSLLKLTLITLLVLSGCKKSNPSTDNSSNNVTLTAIVDIKSGYTCSFDITDATTSDNPILYTQNSVTGSQRFTYQVNQARTLGMDFFVLNSKPTNPVTDVATVSFSANGLQLKTITIEDNGLNFYSLIGTTP